MANSLSQDEAPTDRLDTTGLCLLSLDGGGVRGLSSLYILKGLMTRLNYERQGVGLSQVKPCDIFDLIGDTSTGGLIAIMLGRLEMDVDECITAYRTMMKRVFEKKRSGLSISLTGNVKAQFSSKQLETAVKEVINDRPGFTEDDHFYRESDPDSSRRCRVFVCAKSQETNQITRLRSYRLPGGSDDNPKIWEAGLATSAAPTFFDPVQIGVRKYVDGAIGANNPVSQVEDEAANIWCEDTGRLEPMVKCFISVGTGHADLSAIEVRSWKQLARSIAKVATETRETNERFAGRWRAHLDTRYFRFNVEDGLQRVGLAEFAQEAVIDAGTRLYLDGHALQRKVRDCVQNLRQKRYRPDNQFCLEAIQLQTQHDLSSASHPSTPPARARSTATETMELIERANTTLRTVRDQISRKDLQRAMDDFLRALQGMTFQQPPPTPKEFARIYQKLMSTSLRLSYLAERDERTRHLRDADKYGRLALDNAVRSSNAGRVAQMRFYLACVRAREVAVHLEGSHSGDGALQSKRTEAIHGIATALSELETIDDIESSVYQAMAREYVQPLM